MGPICFHCWFKIIPFIIVFIGPVLIAIFSPQDSLSSEAEGSLVRQAILGLGFFTGMIILLVYRSRFFELLKKNWIIIIFLMFTFFSCFWSPVLIISLKRWIQFLGILLVGMAAMTSEEGPNQILFVFRIFSAFLLILSLLLIITHLAPPYVAESGAWIGFFSTKNELGSWCFLSVAVWLPLVTREKKMWKNILVGFIILIPCILIIKSNSVTAILSASIVIISFVIFRSRLPNYTIPFFIVIFFLLAVLYFSNFGDRSFLKVTFESVGRDSSLTGRTELWSYMIKSIKEHPIIGLGYNSFWIGEFGTSNDFVSRLHWSMNQAHNGYLDILNELGLIGLGLFSFVLYQAIRRTKYFFSSNNGDMSFFLVTIAFVVSNITESSFCRIGQLGWLALLISLVATTPNLLKHKDIDKNDLNAAPESSVVQGSF